MGGTTWRMPPGRRRLAVLAATALVVLVSLGCQRGGAYPQKPITLIMPLAAGSAPDVNFRILAEEAKKTLGQEVVVVNRPGGGGSVGVSEVLQAKPDGYTLGMAAVAMVTLQPTIQDFPYRGPQDVLPIMQVLEAPISISVLSESRWKSVQELVDEAKSKPETVRVGMAERFSILHVELERLQELSGAKLTIVPFGAGEQIPALLGGTVDAAISQPTVILPHVQAGKARMLGIFGEERLEGLEMSTVKEQGYDVTQIPYEFLIAPKGTPQEIVQKLHDSFKGALESARFKEQAEKTKIRVKYLSGDELATKLEADAKVYADVARKLNWGQ